MKRALPLLAAAGVLVTALAAHAQPAPKGDVKTSYVSKDTGAAVPYRIYVPASWTPAKRLPIVVMLHGGGLDYNAPFDREPPELKGEVFKLADRFGYILVAPQGYNAQGTFGSNLGPPLSGPGAPPPPPPAKPGETPLLPRTTSAEIAYIASLSEKDVLEAVDRTAKQYNADTSRLFLMGNSMGGLGAMHLASKYPTRWRAVVASEAASDIARYAAGGDDVTGIKAKGLMVVKKDTDPAAVTAAADMLKVIGAKGVDTQLVVSPNSRHETAWYIALPQIFAFFQKHQS